MWLVLFTVAVALLVYSILIKPLNYWQEKGVPQRKPWFLVGNMGRVLLRKQALTDLYLETYSEYPDHRYVGMFIMNRPALLLRDLDLIKTLMVKEFETFPNHFVLGVQKLDPLWCRNLFNMQYEEGWREMRLILSPAFTSSKMRTMYPLIRQCAEQFVNYFCRQEGIVEVDLRDAFTRYATDVIGTTAFGVTSNSLEQPNNEFYLMGKEATNMRGLRFILLAGYVVSPTLMKLLNLSVFPKTLDTFFRGLINETIKIREENNIVRPDMIHLMLEARKGLLKDEDQSNVPDSGFAVIDESETHKSQTERQNRLTKNDMTAVALGFFFAGFETVSITMCYVCYELALNQNVQGRLFKEIEAAPRDKQGNISYEDLLGMKYLDCVVTETLRKWPPNPVVDRKSIKPFTIKPERSGEKPLHLVPGSNVHIPIFAIHRDSRYYPDPEKFDPDRFSASNKHNINPNAYLPFGAGPRSCSGTRYSLLETKLIIVEILRKYEIIPLDKTPIPMRFSRFQFNPISDTLWLGLKPRLEVSDRKMNL